MVSEVDRRPRLGLVLREAQVVALEKVKTEKEGGEGHGAEREAAHAQAGAAKREIPV